MARQAERRAATSAAMLAAARDLFCAEGYEAVSIDDIATAAGATKGAFYHHFATKQAIFDHLVDQLQGEIASRLAARKPAPGGPEEAMAASIGAYLEAANQPHVQRILLIDGPVVLGWRRWREIDDAHFAGMVRAGAARLMGPQARPAEVDAAARLVLGAVMEAALALGDADDKGASASDYGASLTRLLRGLRPG
ncbi:TetR/AcrR family transcriptional regulator [Phenylobacterium sp.]|uniref:TetR/AcrR family transcriptional regulator n=1 Tax=Phenylobacterium sp. TaxID=1871053 RepID=UPI00289A9AE4|nr:TetR/AcrR family transcriptional regulator [Phenylobacterium sp.]